MLVVDVGVLSAVLAPPAGVLKKSRPHQPSSSVLVHSASRPSHILTEPRLHSQALHKHNTRPPSLCGKCPTCGQLGTQSPDPAADGLAAADSPKPPAQSSLGVKDHRRLAV